MKKILLLSLFGLFLVASSYGQKTEKKLGEQTPQKVEKEVPKKSDEPADSISKAKGTSPDPIPTKSVKADLEATVLSGGSLLIIEYKEAYSIGEMEADTLDADLLKLL